MDQFYFTLLSATTILLILLLTMVGVMMYYSKSTPEQQLQSKCPDYWMYDPSNAVCMFDPAGTNTNAGSLTIADASDKGPLYTQTVDNKPVYYIDPNEAQWATRYKGITADCAKGKWANTNGIAWDGYSNNFTC